MTGPIKVGTLLGIPREELSKHKLHLATFNGTRHPLDAYLTSWDEWVGWNAYRGGKNDFNRDYIFSLIRYYSEPSKWMFGGIFKVVQRLPDSYQLELLDLHKELIGRLFINYYRQPGMMGRAFKLEQYFDELELSEIRQESFQGEDFPGFENLSIDFHRLEAIYKRQKSDWRAALESVKGVYLVADKSNGKKYIGSAYGQGGIWSRWETYIRTGSGWNDELVTLINREGMDYARKNFKLTLLEFMSMKTVDSMVIARESYWKEALLTRGGFGYNKN